MPFRPQVETCGYLIAPLAGRPERTEVVAREHWSTTTPAQPFDSRDVIAIQLGEDARLDKVRAALLALPDFLTTADGTPVEFEVDGRRLFGGVAKIRPIPPLDADRRYRLRVYRQVLANPNKATRSRHRVEVEFRGAELPLLIDRFPPDVLAARKWHGFPELRLSKQVPIEKLAATVTVDQRRVSWIYEGAWRTTAPRDEAPPVTLSGRSFGPGWRGSRNPVPWRRCADFSEQP